MDTLIEASHVSLRFAAPTEKRASLKKWVLDAVRGRIRRRKFMAVDDVSFRIDRGEAVGLVGRNGAGKSTLLKLVTGIANPTMGTIAVRGQVAPLLALGNGLDPELTGRENIYLNGAILGYCKEFLKQNEESIIEFSELGEFIDAPVRTYSSGMTMRLAFSIATAASPEILILDEVLAVGDAAFQEKCQARINEIIVDGATVFFVSHSLSSIVQLCSRAIWLDKGRVVMDGPAAEVADAYRRDIVPSSASPSSSFEGPTQVPVYRFDSPTYGEVILTADEEERAAILDGNAKNWTFRDVAYRAFPGRVGGARPLHRFYNKGRQTHFFTTDPGELAPLRGTSAAWEYEGIAHYVLPGAATGAIPVYRFRNKTTGKYLLTAEEDEAEALRSPDSNWFFEKTAFWAFPPQDSAVPATASLSSPETP